MPIYEYECPTHGKFEKFLPISYSDIKSIPCTEDINCEKRCERIWSQVAYPSHGDPTVIFKNKKTGETEVALYKGQKPPEGFVKEELRTPHERSKFEKEMNVNQKAENEFDTIKRRAITEGKRKQRHSDLNSRLSAITKNSENPSAAAALLKSAMNRSRKKQIPEKKLSFHLAVNHHDKNNLDKG